MKWMVERNLVLAFKVVVLRNGWLEMDGDLVV